MQTLVTDSHLVLEKFPGKGGWTYAVINEIKPDKHAWFGWVKVSGSIDDFPIADFHLMPMGDGRLFLSVRAEIRKKIKKEVGDIVHVVLYTEFTELDVVDNLALCLLDVPEAKTNFEKLNESEKQDYINWISAAKTEDLQVERIAKTIDRLVVGLRFIEKR